MGKISKKIDFLYICTKKMIIIQVKKKYQFEH